MKKKFYVRVSNFMKKTFTTTAAMTCNSALFEDSF